MISKHIHHSQTPQLYIVTMAAAAAANSKYNKKKSSSTSSSSSSSYKKRKFDTANISSAATPSNKKRALKAERQSHRPNSSSVVAAKSIWNDLRIKQNDKATNTKLCNDLYDVLKGKFMNVAMQHDASRCVQGVLQYGNESQRRQVVMELCDSGGTGGTGGNNNNNMNLAELCKIQYAHFVVLKMIKYCARDEVCVKIIVRVS